MKKKYVPSAEPKHRNARLQHLGCELTEAAHTIFKIQRFGANSYNPEKNNDVMDVTNPSNVGELIMELWDVEYAARAAMPDIVGFLGEDMVRALRAEWERKAFGQTESEAHALRVGFAEEMKDWDNVALIAEIQKHMPQFVMPEGTSTLQLIQTAAHFRAAAAGLAS